MSKNKGTKVNDLAEIKTLLTGDAPVHPQSMAKKVEFINGWSHHHVIGNPRDFGAVEGFDENITMFTFSVFPDGSRFAIVPGQVGDSVSTW